MKKTILRASVAGAAVAFGAGFAASAETVNSGFVGANIGYVEVESGGTDADGTNYGVNGAWATPLGQNNFGLQLDASYNTSDFDSGEVDTLSGAAHVFLRESDSHAIGGFADFRNIDAGGADLDITSIGGEGALLRGGFAFEGELAYLNLDGGGADADGFGGAAGFTFYPNETLGYGAFVGLLTVDDGGTDLELTTLGADLEMQIPNTNFTGYGAVTYSNGDFGAVDVESTGIMVGIRFNGGIASPAERQSYGASFNGVNRIAGNLLF